MSTPIGSSQWMYASGAEVTQQSLKFNDDESQYLSWTPAAAGNRKTWTWSGWVKRGNISTSQIFFGVHDGGSQQCWLGWNSGNTIQFFSYQGSTIANVSTQAVFRDVSAWYHLVVAFDAANTTMNMYVNGVDQTLTFNTAISNTDHHINSSSYVHGLGRAGVLTGNDADMYLSDINFIDGQALDPTDFGQFTNGYWEKKDYAGSYGTNGFHLTFADDVVSEGFNTVTYRGNGGTQSISGLGFEPDFVWVKARNVGAISHILQDSVRGSDANGLIGLVSDLTIAESALDTAWHNSYGKMDSFDADGFTVTDGTISGNYNTSGTTYVGWCWDAGSGSPVSNTDGSITSTVKANPSYGFSVVSYTASSSASTIGHGLGTAPSMIIQKNRDASSSWGVYHQDVGATKFLSLDSTAAASTNSIPWNNTNPTSDVFSIGTGYTNGNKYIAYCFNSVAGYSSIGSYTGNGSTSGPTVTTGFRPAFVMIKATDTAHNWVIYDSTRNPDTSGIDLHLRPNSNIAEQGALDFIEFTSTGFQIKIADNTHNTNGNNYIYMAFADTREAAFWKDVSGQGNHWTPSGLDYRDSLIDSPANNFAVMNPLLDTTGNITFSEGNLKTVDTNASTSGSAIAVNSGKWFAEMVCTAKTASNAMVGICTVDGFDSDRQLDESLIGGSGHGYVMNATKLPGGAAYGATWAIGDVIGIALDLDSAQNTVTFYKNGSSQGAININNAEYVFCNSNGQGSSTVTYVSNFGQDSTFSGARPAGGNTDANNIGDFAYSVPAGFLSLCSASLPTPTIIDGSEHFNTVLYTGDDANPRSLTGIGFQPDFVWTKQRTNNGGGFTSHQLYDSVRGTQKLLRSNTTDAELANPSNGGVQSFDADGFTIQGSSASVNMNDNTETYAAWNWKAGGTAVSNTDGSITSQVSANVDAGFSIVSYTGTGANATVGHGLNSAPEMIITKARTNGSSYWLTYHSGLASPSTSYMSLNTTNAVDTGGASVWNSTSPTSSVFSVGTSTWINPSGGTMIAYCFANTDTTKVGSYTGNGSSDGPFVYTGFRPAFVIMKRTDFTSDWVTIDDARSTYNAVDDVLIPNNSNAEVANLGSGYEVDFTSNGFKVRSTWSAQNASGGTYIYLAFAETPFKYATAR